MFLFIVNSWLSGAVIAFCIYLFDFCIFNAEGYNICLINFGNWAIIKEKIKGKSRKGEMKGKYRIVDRKREKKENLSS